MLYCLDLKTNEIHVLGCSHIPHKNIDKVFLERFNNPNDAVTYAESIGYTKAFACIYCCFSAYTE